MPTIESIQRRQRELGDEVKAKLKVFEAGRITAAEFNSYIDRAEAESDDLAAQVNSNARAKAFRACASDGTHDPDVVKAKGRWSPPSPLHASQAQFKSLFRASCQRLGGYTVGVGIDTKGADGFDIQTKAAVGEGSPGTLLPAELLPDAFMLRLEPDRLFSHFVGMAADSQSVTYLEHTSNTNPAAAVPELTQKPDLGMVVVPKTVSFTVIAALQSFSRQLADDFKTWMTFVPAEMTRAIYDAETNFVLNDTTTGILHTSGTLSRAVGADTPIDAVVKSFNDIRTGSSFGVADLCVMHPSTWTFLKTEKNSLGSYLLAPNDPNSIGDVKDLFGVEVITNTKVPVGTVISLDSKIAVLAWTRRGLELMLNQFGDTEFQTNALTYRCEERIAIGVQRPSAICVVTGVTVPGS